MAILRSFRSGAWLLLPVAIALVSPAARATVQRDFSYQGTGRVFVDFANEGDERSRGVALDPTTGRAVFVGQVASGGMKMGIARLNTDGSPDTSFSADGRTAIEPCAPGAFLNVVGGKNVAVQPDGKIVFVANCSGPDQIAVVRLLGNGDLDNSFDGDGVALIANPTLAAGARGNGLALQSDGKIVVAGSFGLNAGAGHATVFRLDAGGSIDGTFATSGYYTSSLDHSYLNVVRTMADGRIVAGGHVNLPAVDGRLNFVILRLTAAGTRDPQFNGGNELNFNVGGRSPVDPSVMTQDQVNDLALRPDGTIVVAGNSDPPLGVSVPILAQFTVAGALDTNWGTAGYFVPPGGSSGGVAFALALRPTGDLLTTGRAIMVTQVSANGQDSSSLAFVEEQGYTLALQGDGRFVAAVDQDAFSHEFLATRYLATLPAPDTTPDAFSFSAASNVALSSVVTAQAIIMGVSDPTPVSVSGGEYSVGCTATWKGAADADVISNAETVCVRHTSSGSSTTAVSTTLTIGGVAATFTSTTGDLVPDAFTFVDQTNVAKSTSTVSAGVTINGISLPTPVSVTGGEYSINCGATYTNVAGTVANGQAICVRHVSSALGATAITTTLTVGGVSDVFSTTTVADPPAPPPNGGGGGGGGGGGSLDLWLLTLLGLIVAAAMRSRTRSGQSQARNQIV